MQVYRIPCRSAFGRPGECTVVVSDLEAVLTVPPGEAARLTSRQLFELLEALRAVSLELFQAEHQTPPPDRQEP